ncbi:MAG: hypothetical protein M1133_07900 [Armatimonadetes bacterium]|nr:hypothetical protein [Armatimonadota bacterium]
MNKVLKSFCAVLAALIVGLAGCGGGGGTTTSSGSTGGTTPPLGQSRVITGRVVSTASNSPGVAGVIVRLGDTDVTGTTDSVGNFTLNLGTLDIPSFIQVDPSTAGSGYSKEYTVTLNDQQYPSEGIDIPVNVRNEVATAMGTMTVVYLDPNSDTPPSGSIYPSYDTVIVGRVIRSDTLAGVAGVTVRFGTALAVTTGQKGYFAVNLGRDAAVLPLFPTGSLTFSIDSSTAGTTYPSTLEVQYSSQFYTQSAIPVPDDVIQRRSSDLGTLSLQVGSSDSGGGSGPPAPPL